ncbi:methyltransferase domain-containing protein [archaeon]|nr:methyltransferase domain-containing protein [archaeon]
MGYEKLKEIYENQDANIDSVAFDSGLIIQREWHKEKLRHILKNIDIKDKIILDAGCGSGAFDRKMEKCARMIIGVDINKFVVSYAMKKSHNKPAFASGNIENIPLKDSSVDVIVCLDALDHCLEPKKVIEEFSRLLKAGGKGVIIVQNHTRLWRFAEYMWDRFGRGREYGHVHVSRFDKNNISDVFRIKNIEVESMYSIHHFSPLILAKKPWSYPEFIEKRFRKKLVGFSIVIVIKKII